MTKSLSSNEQQTFRNVLLRERDALLSIQRQKSDLAAPRVCTPEDLGPRLHEQFIAVERHDLAFQKLKSIHAALDRLDSGEYGICLECGNPISRKRLESVPWASRCTPCEELAAEPP